MSSPFVSKIAPQHNFKTLPLRSQTIQSLQTFTQHIDQRSISKAAKHKSLRTSPKTTALFTGLNHKGKLAAAEAIAAELKRPLYKIDISRLETKYIGETEKNLASFFNKAGREGAILFFDEADALFGKRTDVSDAHDRYANIEPNYLFKRIAQYHGLVILSTNKSSSKHMPRGLTIRASIIFPCATSQDC